MAGSMFFGDPESGGYGLGLAVLSAAARHGRKAQALPPIGEDLALSSSDTAYYLGRVMTERSLAEVSGAEDAAAIHNELAGHYQAIVDQGEMRPMLRTVFLGWARA